MAREVRAEVLPVKNGCAREDVTAEMGPKESQGGEKVQPELIYNR